MASTKKTDPINIEIEARKSEAQESGEKFSVADFFRELGIQSAIQSVLGLVAVASRNPSSRTFRNLRGPLRQLRDGLNLLPLD